MADEGAQTAKSSFTPVVHSWRHWWRNSVVATVDQAQVIADRREEARVSARYLFMLSMSAGIAILGLLLSSPAVVIGAMLLSPLMGPIMGLGFAMASGDYQWMKQSARSLVLGTVLSIVLCAAMVAFSPLQTVTPEIAARTKPNLFDLGIALFSGLAGSYAMIRGREGAIVGVAIATALMPPLAVIGFGLATLNWTVFTGSLWLFFTNLMTIALTAAVMARLYGFRTSLSEKHTLFQNVLIAVAFVALAVPLAVALWHVADQANDTRLINGAVRDAFDKRARLSEINIEFRTQPIQVSATVLTPEIRPDAERVTTNALESRLGKPVHVQITQYQVGTSAVAAERAQLQAAQAKEAADVAHADALAARLALVAGVKPDDVVIDRQHRRALVTARPLEGAGLSAYRELEQRIAATEPEWQIELKPPARPLPEVAFKAGQPTPDGQDAIDLIAWAAKRIGAPLLIEGTPAETARLGELLDGKGVMVRAVKSWRHPGKVAVRWDAPGDGQAA